MTLYEQLTQYLLEENPEVSLNRALHNGQLYMCGPAIIDMVSYQCSEYIPLWRHVCEVTKNTSPHPILRWSAFLHDIGKPVSAIYSTEHHRTQFPFHATIGAKLARNFLKGIGAPWADNVRITTLIGKHHSFNFYSEQKEKWTDGYICQVLDGMWPDLDLLFDLMRSDVNNSGSRGRQVRRDLRIAQERCKRIKRSLDLGPVEVLYV